MKAVVFLLRGAGWAAIGIFVGFVVSYFFRFSGRVDVFAFTETMLGIVITGLAIVGAFIVALQWSNLDIRIQAFDIEMRKTKDTIQESEKTVINIIRAIEDGYKMHEETLSDFPNKYLEIMSRYTDRIKKDAEIVERETENIRTLRKMMEELDKHYKLIGSTMKMHEILFKMHERKDMLNGIVESEPTTKAS